MKLRIEHRLHYSYTEPVWLEAVLVRLHPICNPFQKVDKFQLRVVREPAGSSSMVDSVGNPALRLWFTGLHSELTLHAFTEASTQRDDPFGFLLEPESVRLPFEYAEPEQAALGVYLPSPSCPAVRGLAQQVVEETSGETIPFLVMLTRRIHGEIALQNRPRGDPLHPEDTLRRGKGACRDLARLMMEACRAVGIAARFVSGYTYQPDLHSRELHAWCEVFIPGGGWRGFDPSTGLAVDSRYLALAAGPTHHEARPTWGTYRGAARSRLRTRIRIEPL